MNSDFQLALDHKLFLRIGERWQVISFLDVVALYRLSDFSKGTVQPSNWGHEFVKMWDNFYTNELSGHKYMNLRDEAYASAYYHAACSYLDDEDYERSREYFVKSLRVNKNYQCELRWWLDYLRTFFGKVGNQSHYNLKSGLARKGLLPDIEYGRWTALKLYNH